MRALSVEIGQHPCLCAPICRLTLARKDVILSAMYRAISALKVTDWLVVSAGLVLIAVLQVYGAEEPQKVSASSAWAKWSQEAEGFAAFARGESGRYGWVTGRNTLAAAEHDALSFCGNGCRIVDTRTEVISHAALSEPISRYTLEHFEAYLRKRPPKAFAVTDGGSVGYSYGKISAKADALVTCAGYDASRDERLSSYPCRIIHSVP